MSVLSALAARYDFMASNGDAPGIGFGPAKIHFTIVLSELGSVVSVNAEERDAGGRLKKEAAAPQPPKRTSGIASGVFWDKTSYVLGRTAVDTSKSDDGQMRDATRCAKEHAAFKARHDTLLKGVEDTGCAALAKFLAGWDPAQFDSLPLAAEMLDQNIAFRLDGDRAFLHDRPAARSALHAESADKEAGPEGFCLVSGVTAPIERLHPSIKGIPGGQTAGTALVSFNLDAFNSYGNSQGFNAPVSEAAAFAYATALNSLISAQDGIDAKGRPLWRNRVSLGSDTVVFWAETPLAEAVVAQMFGQPAPDETTETAEVRSVMQRLEAGRPVHEAAPNVAENTKVYVLGLSPNAARLSVRFWVEDEFGDFTKRFQEHWADMRLEPPPRDRPPAIWALLYELAPLRKIDDGLRHMAGELMRAVLTGTLYPASLLSQALMRLRAENTASPLRVSIIKAVLTRKLRKAWDEERRKNPAHPEWKDRFMALNREEKDKGYQLGRLFAVLDAVQYAGLGRKVNAGVKEKFFSSASATPRHVFPTLLRGAQDHLSAARKKGREGRAGRLEGDMREILNGFPSPGLFPPVLTPDEQGAFVVGFYHQDADLRIPRAKNETIPDTESPETADEED